MWAPLRWQCGAVRVAGCNTNHCSRVGAGRGAFLQPPDRQTDIRYPVGPARVAEVAAAVAAAQQVQREHLQPGGGEGALNRFSWTTSKGTFTPPLASKVTGVRIAKGERIRLETPGGGGYGDPSERDPERIARDIRLGYVSEAAAVETYASSPAEPPKARAVRR